MGARQLVIRNQVETILNHLEYLEAACPEAQADLVQIIGERAGSVTAFSFGAPAMP